MNGGRVKDEWESGEGTKELAAASWQEGKISDVILSNYANGRHHN